MQAYATEHAPIIARGEGFELIDVDGHRFLDGISSLWCNVHGHRVPEIDAAIRDQLDRVAHSTLLGLSSVPSIELARQLIELLNRAVDQPSTINHQPASHSPSAIAPRLTHVFYSDSGATAVEAALKIAYQYHRQKPQPERRDLFVSVGGAYHGDTLGSVSVGSIELFHRVYGDLLFKTISVPSPVTFRLPVGHTPESYLAQCNAELERVIVKQQDRIAGFIIEPLVQGAAGILVHPPGYLRRVRELTETHGIPLIADEVAVGFGRTGTMFACEQEQIIPDIMCLAKGITGGYLPLAATVVTDGIYDAFLAAPHAGKTFYHGHTYTGNPLACAAALASIDLFEKYDVLANVRANALRIAERLAPLVTHPHVGEIRQKGVMVGIELVQDRDTKSPFPLERRTGHLVTLAARKRNVILRPLGDVVVLMPAPAMPRELIDRLCDVAIEAIDEAVQG